MGAACTSGATRRAHGAVSSERPRSSLDQLSGRAGRGRLPQGLSKRHGPHTRVSRRPGADLLVRGSHPGPADGQVEQRLLERAHVDLHLLRAHLADAPAAVDAADEARHEGGDELVAEPSHVPARKPMRKRRRWLWRWRRGW